MPTEICKFFNGFVLAVVSDSLPKLSLPSVLKFVLRFFWALNTDETLVL